MEESELKAEMEVLELLISSCRAVRNPANKKNRLELTVPAARWEAKLAERQRELNEKLRS